MVRVCSLFNAKERSVTFLNGQTYSLASEGSRHGLLTGRHVWLQWEAQLAGSGAWWFVPVHGFFVGVFGKTRAHTHMHITCKCTQISWVSSLFPISLSDGSGMVEVRPVCSLLTLHHADDSNLFPKQPLHLPDLRRLNNLHSNKLMAFLIDSWKPWDQPGRPQRTETFACPLLVMSLKTKSSCWHSSHIKGTLTNQDLFLHTAVQALATQELHLHSCGSGPPQ